MRAATAAAAPHLAASVQVPCSTHCNFNSALPSEIANEVVPSIDSGGCVCTFSSMGCWRAIKIGIMLSLESCTAFYQRAVQFNDPS